MSLREERLLSVKDVAQLMGVDERTIRRWVTAGRLPAPLQVGPNTVRFRPEDIEQFMERQRRPTP
jgi:excisionase family DNA binding protein